MNNQMLVFVGLIASAGCSLTVSVPQRKPANSPPTTLVPKEQGDEFAAAVSECRSYGSALSEFAQRVRNRQNNSGTWALITTSGTIATGAATATFGAYYGSDPDKHSKGLENTGLYGGIGTALLGVPAALFTYYSTAQATDATAASTAASSIDDIVIKKLSDLGSAAGKTDQEKSALAWKLTEELLTECQKAIHAEKVPNVPDAPAAEAAPQSLRKSLRMKIVEILARKTPPTSADMVEMHSLK